MRVSARMGQQNFTPGKFISESASRWVLRFYERQVNSFVEADFRTRGARARRKTFTRLSPRSCVSIRWKAPTYVLATLPSPNRIMTTQADRFTYSLTEKSFRGAGLSLRRT